MVFVLDNYDSFTYNLVQYLGELGEEVVVRRNDELTPEEIVALKPERILLSPGPCTPQEAGILIPLIQHLAALPQEAADSSARRLPRPPGHRRGVWRRGHPRAAAHARQDQRHRARRPQRLPQAAAAHDLHALPLAHREREERPGRVSKSPPGSPARRPAIAPSWACATARCPLKACSSTPSPSSPTTASSSSPTS